MSVRTNLKQTFQRLRSQLESGACRQEAVRCLIDEGHQWDQINHALCEAERRGLCEPRRVRPVIGKRCGHHAAA